MKKWKGRMEVEVERRVVRVERVERVEGVGESRLAISLNFLFSSIRTLPLPLALALLFHSPFLTAWIPRQARSGNVDKPLLLCCWCTECGCLLHSYSSAYDLLTTSIN